MLSKKEMHKDRGHVHGGAQSHRGPARKKEAALYGKSERGRYGVGGGAHTPAAIGVVTADLRTFVVPEAGLRELYEDPDSNQPSVATEGDSLSIVQQRKKCSYSKSVANFEAFSRMNSMNATKALLEKSKLAH